MQFFTDPYNYDPDLDDSNMRNHSSMRRRPQTASAEGLQSNLARHAKAYEHSLSHSESYAVDDGKFWMSGDEGVRLV